MRISDWSSDVCSSDLMTQRRWGLVLARNVAVGVARFPLLAIDPVDSRAVWLLVIAALPTALSGFGGLALLPRVTGARHQLAPMPERVRPDRKSTRLNSSH